MKKIILLIAGLMVLIDHSAFANLHYTNKDLAIFESTGVCEKCDLSGIRWGVTTGSENKLNHNKADITAADLSVSDLDAVGYFDLSGSNAQGADFTDSSFQRTSFFGANLHNAIFTHAGLISVDFSHANLTGARFTNIVTGNSRDPDQDAVTFEDADLTGAAFTNAVLKRVDFYGAKGVDYSDAALVCGGIDPDGTVQAPCKP